MAEKSEKQFSDFEDEGLLPIMDMLNFKIARLDEGEIGFRDEDKLYITPDEKYYAEEYCRLNELVDQWKSRCEAKGKKVAELEKKVQRLEKENDQLKKKTVNLKEVESIMQEQQHVLEAIEGKYKKAEEDFRNKLAEEKCAIERKEKIILVLETKLRDAKKKNQNTEQKMKDLSDFLLKCNHSLEENINSLVNEFSLTASDPETSDNALGIGDDDDHDDELVHLKLKRNLCKLSAVVRKTFTEILAMGNENNGSISITEKGNGKTSNVDTCQNQQLCEPYENDDQYHPVCSPVTPEQCSGSDS